LISDQLEISSLRDIAIAIIFDKEKSLLFCATDRCSKVKLNAGFREKQLLSDFNGKCLILRAEWLRCDVDGAQFFRLFLPSSQDCQ
jgi:hypothetical protein